MSEIKKILFDDIKRVVKIHMKAFPSFFMTELGAKFLFQYYSMVLGYQKSIFLKAEMDGLIVGFIAGFIEPDKFYASLNKNKIQMGKTIILALFRKPKLLLRIIANFRRINKLSIKRNYNICELASIAVDPDYSGHGIGKKLVNCFLYEAKQLGAEMVYLTTDARNNDYVNNFYESLGFTLYRTFFNEYRREMNEYRYYFKK
jgi:ribosomal protein S18 acetylase RimI-like enzyme